MGIVSPADANTANWICAALAIVILLIRLIATRIRDGQFTKASYLVLASLVVLVVRVIVVYYYLLYGTSNDLINAHASFSKDSDGAEVKTGSVLTVIARFLITTFYWLQICLLLLFYAHLVSGIHWVNTIRACWATIGITYTAVVLTTFLECHPFHLYWQVTPNPGRCVRAYAQLLAQGICNIILDLFLLVISYPVLMVPKRTLSQKLRVGLLFTLGFFCIIITCLRIGYIFAEDSYQPVRSFWASVQMFVSTFVANTPTIYGCLQLMIRRKSVQRGRRASRPEDWMQLPSIVDIPLRQPPEMQMPSIPLQFARPSRSAVDVKNADKDAWSRPVS